MNIESIYNKCFKAIDGSKNQDVIWYTKKRPKTITRTSFFKYTVFAIWVSGLKRRSADSFLKRAKENGFKWDFLHIAKQNPEQWKEFKTILHGENIPKRAEMKWDAVKLIAEKLNKIKDNAQFRKEWFEGKRKSFDLNSEDVKKIHKMKLPFIGRANAHFIIRNMGGEAIKCDRWLEAFMNYHKIKEHKLLKSLENANIPAGLFDVVIWAYCEKFIKKTNRFNNHFKTEFKI